MVDVGGLPLIASNRPLPVRCPDVTDPPSSRVEAGKISQSGTRCAIGCTSWLLMVVLFILTSNFIDEISLC
jgi:hypothetical protein